MNDVRQIEGATQTEDQAQHSLEVVRIDIHP